ncbi:hypothetical protein PYW08_004430 [Mythimna loreyi]|uniref:Uncharacterized protein n=1 Tax=Mythimna loreyi TaxID=667449 RepID=A0ACC2QT03_9NEOP|nr:hypothetical protein PYW08_004430 [Mythimna loreyi]
MNVPMKEIISNKVLKSLNSINLVHQNIQGLMNKDLEVELFLNCNNVDIFCITEHWLKSHQLMFNFSNHQVGSSFCRVDALRGGSLILVSNHLKFKERKDIVSLSVERSIEIACIELEQFIILSVYKPPSGLYDCFENVMDEVFNKICNSNKYIITCGDFNINLLENSALCSKVISLFQSYNLVNLFLEPTRVTPTSATCIDNIYTDVLPIHKEIINLLDSDHCGQLITFQNPNIIVTKKNITVNPKTANRLESFKTKLINNLPVLSTLDDVNPQYEDFFNMYCKQFNSTFIPKTISVNSNVSFSEWATIGIHKSRTRLYELYDERVLVNTAEFSLYVRNYSKLFKKVCSVAKSRYLSSKIKNSNNKIKTTWNIINSETGRSTKPCSDYSLIIDDNVIN